METTFVYWSNIGVILAFTPKEEPQFIDDLSVHAPQHFAEFQHQALAANITLDMQELLHKHEACSQGLKLQMKPRRALIAKSQIHKAKLAALMTCMCSTPSAWETRTKICRPEITPPLITLMKVFPR